MCRHHFQTLIPRDMPGISADRDALSSSFFAPSFGMENGVPAVVPIGKNFRVGENYAGTALLTEPDKRLACAIPAICWTGALQLSIPLGKAIERSLHEMERKEVQKVKFLLKQPIIDESSGGWACQALAASVVLF